MWFRFFASLVTAVLSTQCDTVLVLGVDQLYSEKWHKNRPRNTYFKSVYGHYYCFRIIVVGSKLSKTISASYSCVYTRPLLCWAALWYTVFDVVYNSLECRQCKYFYQKLIAVKIFNITLRVDWGRFRLRSGLQCRRKAVLRWWNII